MYIYIYICIYIYVCIGSDLRYVDLQIWTVFPSTILSDRYSVYSIENSFEVLGTPEKTCLVCTGTPVKTCCAIRQFLIELQVL